MEEQGVEGGRRHWKVDEEAAAAGWRGVASRGSDSGRSSPIRSSLMPSCLCAVVCHWHGDMRSSPGIITATVILHHWLGLRKSLARPSQVPVCGITGWGCPAKREVPIRWRKVAGAES